jgi:Arabinose efflux permease
MSSSSEPTQVPVQQHVQAAGEARTQFISSLFHMPRNVYLLLIFTTGKGFQLSIAALVLNYYIHSLGYHEDFIGICSAMPAIGSLVGALPTALVADRIGRKPILIFTALLTPLSLALCALATSAPLLIALNLLQGVVSAGYWVTNLPLLTESTNANQRVGVLALNSFLLLGVGALGNLLGGAVPEIVAGIMHVSSASPVPLRWGVLVAASFTFIFGLPLWVLQEPRRSTIRKQTTVDTESKQHETAIQKEVFPFWLFAKLLLPDLFFTMGEGSVVALIQIYFVLRFHLLPGPLGIIFTISGVAGGIFSLTAPLFVRRWSKLRLITTVQYLTVPLMLLIGFAPTMPLAISAEYTRSFMRTLIEPVYAAFAMEQVSDRRRAALAGFYSTTWSVGYSIGPTIGGWLQSGISLSASFVFGALCLLIAPTLLITFFGHKAVRPA